VLAEPFNKSIMNLVWKESLSQTDQMMTPWALPAAKGPNHEIQSIAKDMRTLSLNVLAATGLVALLPSSHHMKN
jgi:hypothetical protein